MYKRGRIWWITYRDDAGRYRCESSGTTNRRIAQKLEDMRKGAVVEGRLALPRSNPPSLELWSSRFLESIQNPVTKNRYGTSVRALLSYFRNARLSQITADRIDEFKGARLRKGVRSATVNRDLAVLRRMLKLAARDRLIAQTPFAEVEFLEEKKQRRQPHILTFEEEKRLVGVASPRMRALVALIVETGLRIGKEAFPLEWTDLDLLSGAIHIRDSKTIAGRRNLPLSDYCKAELIHWRNLVGPEFSRYIFPNLKKPSVHLKSVKKNWRTTLKRAGISYFPIYNLRATFASRLSAAGTPDVLVAQMIGHSTASILQTYAKAIDVSRREAVKRFEAYRKSHIEEAGRVVETCPESPLPDKRARPTSPVGPKKPYTN